MTFRQFSEIVFDWNVSQHFLDRMRIALTTGNKAKFDPNHLTKVDMRFLAEHGYELDIDTMEVSV